MMYIMTLIDVSSDVGLYSSCLPIASSLSALRVAEVDSANTSVFVFMRLHVANNAEL